MSPIASMRHFKKDVEVSEAVLRSFDCYTGPKQNVDIETQLARLRLVGSAQEEVELSAERTRMKWPCPLDAPTRTRRYEARGCGLHVTSVSGGRLILIC